jgi:hypothetical protein
MSGGEPMPDSDSRSVLIAIPTYNGEISATTFGSVFQAIREAEAAGWKASYQIRPLDSLPPRARNHLALGFLNSGATDLVFWDADVATCPGAFAALLAHDVDVVGGVYRLRQDPERYPIRPLPGGLIEDPATGLIEVDGIATGFLRIRRGALERMIAHFPDLWADERGVKIPWLFDYELRDHNYFSEDYVFCRRFREAGGRVWADPSLPFHHTGPKTFSGLYARHLGAQRAAATTPAELEAASRRLEETIAGFERGAA